MTTRADTAEFIRKAMMVHGSKYIYGDTEYSGYNKHVSIGCSKHGMFTQKASRHLSGRGCRKCAAERNGKKKLVGTEEFVRRATEIHGGYYDYSKSQYVASVKKLIITCPLHGDFEQTPNSHLSGRRCDECSKLFGGDKRKLRREDFISKSRAVHGEKYDYSKTEVTFGSNEVCIVCPHHGCFSQKASAHMTGRGCMACKTDHRVRKRSLTFLEFVEKARSVHGDRYEYHEDFYEGSSKKTIVTCKEHGEWVVGAGHHIHNHCGCPKCSRSKGELAIEKWLIENGVGFETEKKFESLGLLRFDFFLPDHNLLIEFDGKQHFREVRGFKNSEDLRTLRERDERKNRWAWENGYMLMRIPYWMKDRIPELLHRQLTMFVPEAA